MISGRNILSYSLNITNFIYISSVIPGYTKRIQKQIQITVLNCEVDHWDKCINSNKICEIWSSGYNLTEISTCIVPIIPKVKASKTAKAMTKTTQSMTGSTAGVVGGASLANTSSLSSIWSMVNQMQILFRFINLINKILYFYLNKKYHKWI